MKYLWTLQSKSGALELAEGITNSASVNTYKKIN